MSEIIINGKATPIHFGLKAINEYSKVRDEDFGETVSSTAALTTIDTIVSVTTIGLNEGARRNNLATRYTEDEVWDLFDETPTLIIDISKIFAESITPLVDKIGESDRVQQVAARQAAKGK